MKRATVLILVLGMAFVVGCSSDDYDSTGGMIPQESTPNSAPYGSCESHEDCLDEWCQGEFGWSVCSTICSPGVACPTVPGFDVQCLLPAEFPWNEHCAVMCGSTGECPRGMSCTVFEAGSICTWGA